MSLLRNTILTGGASAIALPAAFLASVLLTRWLPVEARGMYSVAAACAGLISLIGMLGGAPTLVFRIRRAGALPARMIGLTLAWVAGYSALVAVGLLALPDLLTQRFLAGTPLVLVLLAVASAPFQILSTLLSAIARAMNRFDLAARYVVVESTSHLALLALVLSFVSTSTGAALLALLTSRFGSALMLVSLVVAVAGLARPPPLSELRDTLRFALRAHAQTLAGTLRDRLDPLLVAFFLADPAQNAFFAVALSVTRLMLVVPESVSEAVYPQLAGSSRESAANTTAFVLRHSIFWMGVLCPAVAISAALLVPLVFGEPYAASVAPLQVMLVGLFFAPASRVTLRYFNALDRPDVPLASQSIATLSSLGLALWLVPSFGVIGAAWSRVAFYLIGGAIGLLWFWRSNPEDAARLLRPRASDLRVYPEKLAELQERFRMRR